MEDYVIVIEGKDDCLYIIDKSAIENITFAKSIPKGTVTKYSRIITYSFDELDELFETLKIK